MGYGQSTAKRLLLFVKENNNLDDEQERCTVFKRAQGSLIRGRIQGRPPRPRMDPTKSLPGGVLPPILISFPLMYPDFKRGREFII
jgi:hypothetical protein